MSTPPPPPAAPSDDARTALSALRDEVARIVVGQDSTVTGLVTALLVRGHVLLEGVPGVAKTLLVKTLGQALDVRVARVQCTPDLLPADITGQPVLDSTGRATTFREGPVFTNLLLADELNRTPPKTQSALLEAMEERQVSVEGQPRPLPDPFLVIATQNPLEHSGTFPLPDSQLDRFLLRARMGYPAPAFEAEILRGGGRAGLAELEPVLDLDQLAALRRSVEAVSVHDDVVDYLVAIVAATRTWEVAEIGASPRASLDLHAAVRAWAFMDGRSHVVPDDVKTLAGPVLAHRIVSRQGGLSGERLTAMLETLVDSVPVPA